MFQALPQNVKNGEKTSCLPTTAAILPGYKTGAITPPQLRNCLTWTQFSPTGAAAENFVLFVVIPVNFQM